MSQDIMKSLLRRIGRGGEVINQHGDQMRDPMARRETLELITPLKNRLFENVFQKW